MASRVLSVPKSLLPGIALLVQHKEKLEKLKSAIEGLQPKERSVQSIARQVAGELDVSLSDARALILPLMSFHQLRETFAMSPAETFDALTKSLEVDATDEWKSKNFDAWRASRSQIEAVLSGNHPLYFVQKNLRLKYEHANILRDASIVVDARPVFDEGASDIAQWAVDYVLQVEFYDGESVKRLYATLDAKDVEKLKMQCERAVIKTATLEAMLARLERPVVVTGDDEQ